MKTNLTYTIQRTGEFLKRSSSETAANSFPLRRKTRRAAGAICGIMLLVGTLRPVFANDTEEMFPSPDAAVQALSGAVSAKNQSALRAIFGPAVKDIENPDLVQATNEFNAFSKALSSTNYLEHESDTRCVLEVGENSWPFPIPLVEKHGEWFFDTAAGKEEILNRRVGRNELNTLQVVRAYVEAQREYASSDRNGSEVLQFAQKLVSSPGQEDGLYWPPDLNSETSPLGPLVAFAQGQGYSLNSANRTKAAQPYNGYYFKILTSQGKHAPGGAYNYIINGNMIAGFALVAWPAEYGRTGIMTFIVNQQGRVYQKDLGQKTAKLASKMKRYDPDSTWQLSPD